MKKKILYLSFYDFNGGAAIAAYKFFKLIPKNKYDVDFYCYKKFLNNPAVKELQFTFLSYSKFLFNFSISRLIFFFTPLKEKQKRSLCIFSTGALARIDLKKYDIIHYHWIFNELISIHEMLSFKKKIIITIHDLWFLNGSTHYNSENVNFLTKILEKFLKKNKIEKLKKKKNLTITTPSLWTHTQFAKKLKNTNIKIIPNDGRLITKKKIKHISDKNEKIYLRNKYNLPVDEFIGLINFDQKNVNIKGYDLLNKILTKLNKLDKIKYLMIFGKGTEELDFKKFSNLIFLNLGFVDYNVMSEIYRLGDITLLPSRQETYSQIVSESIDMNVPVVTFDNSGQVELYNHKINGYKAKAFDCNDFIKGILYFYNKKTNSLFKKNINYNKLNRLNKLIRNLYD